MRFFLGTHMPSWLTQLDVPMFISHRRLAGRRTLPRALGPWALDSGGFTELSMFGEWRTTPATYAASVRRYAAEIGQLLWVSPQDWMVEDAIRAQTHLSVLAHQLQTVANFQALRDLLGPLVVPVIQGMTRTDYLRCCDLYDHIGVDLTAEPLVGLGSVCRRQGSQEIADLVTELAGAGLALHGYGIKSGGIARIGDLLTSSDSMAWSARGRRVPGCTSTHVTEANCQLFALTWRTRLLAKIPHPTDHGADL